MLPKVDLPASPHHDAPGVFRDVPFMGVIFVVAEAEKRGYKNGHPDWVNLGQGQPEVGELKNAPPRVDHIDLRVADHAYGPVQGTMELRSAIAKHYNRLYRGRGQQQYGPQHVSVAQGGRLALSRALAAFGDANVGYQLPDYTAYEDMLALHLSRITPHPIRTSPENGFLLDVAQFAALARDSGLGAFLLSNPCNPTGQVLKTQALGNMLCVARRERCTLLLDEFYSHYIYSQNESGDWMSGDAPISMAAVVDDVNEDPVLIFDGLTKNYRYPGWRVGWTIGPPDLIDTLTRVGSALDGGASQVSQRAAAAILEPRASDQETAAVRAAFVTKRNVMVERLQRMGVTFPAEPDSTFYAWGSVAALPHPLNDGMAFFRRALDHRVLTVPGVFFDVNPGRRRRSDSPYHQYVRFSFGPRLENMLMGLDRLAAMVKAHEEQ